MLQKYDALLTGYLIFFQCVFRQLLDQLDSLQYKYKRKKAMKVIGHVTNINKEPHSGQTPHVHTKAANKLFPPTVTKQQLNLCTL